MWRKKINIMQLKKKLFWFKINNIKRKNKKLNIELLQNIFNYKKKKKYINFFINSTGQNFVFHLDEKHYETYSNSKYYYVYSNIKKYM